MDANTKYKILTNRSFRRLGVDWREKYTLAPGVCLCASLIIHQIISISLCYESGWCRFAA